MQEIVHQVILLAQGQGGPAPSPVVGQGSLLIATPTLDSLQGSEGSCAEPEATLLTGGAERSLFPRGAGTLRGITVSYFSTWASFSSSLAVVPGKSQRALSQDAQKQSSWGIMEVTNTKVQARPKTASPEIPSGNATL